VDDNRVAEATGEADPDGPPRPRVARPAWASMATQTWRPVPVPGALAKPPPPAPAAPEPPPPPPREVNTGPRIPAPRSPAPSEGPDPEQALAAFEWRYDPDTLREVVDERESLALLAIGRALTARIDERHGDADRARLFSLRAAVGRVLGDLPRALADGRRALAHAEATGELRRIAIVQARLAHVLQWAGEFAEADRLFALANSGELPDRLRASMHQHIGKCAYDQGRYMEACNHFEKALDLRRAEDPDMIAQTELALDAVFRRVAERGWGPYPRTPEELLHQRRPPVPTFSEEKELWGFTGADGRFVVAPRYTDVQPFRDGVAWVQLPGALAWALIDLDGAMLVQPATGYLGVGSFADGMAWVARNGTSNWLAIDKTGAVMIPPGYDDVRPFRRGLAAVSRDGRWGAVNAVGDEVVPLAYDGFATALADGRYIDGFNDEGLAVVILDGRKGVVDRTGHVLVPSIHTNVVIHPVAYLIVDRSQHWGALDRRGRLLVEPRYPSRTGVIDELDRLLADTKPVL
jgi:tetratricopeptide (TPR) repeat protein